MRRLAFSRPARHGHPLTTKGEGITVTCRYWPSAAILLLLTACGGEPATPTAAEAAETDRGAQAEQPTDFDPVLLGFTLGSTAKRLCSSVFVSGRTVAHVMAEELRGAAAQGLSFDLSEDSHTATASAAGQSATALHRPGLGCTLLAETTADALSAQFDATTHPAAVTPSATALWPEGNRVALEDSAPGIDMAAVQAAIDQAFAENDPEHQARTRAVVVVHDGRIVAERYAAPFNEQTPQLGWSMTKTVTNALTGLLVTDGVLELDAPAPVVEWQAQSEARREITLDHLLQMSSGLEFSEVYTADAGSDVVNMLYGTGAHAMGAYAAAKPLAHAPGSHWSYASGTTNLLSAIHRQSFVTQGAYFAFPRERLFNKLKMASAVLEPDESGAFVGSSYMYATPRDWARVGLLYLQDGVWEGERLLPEGWVDYSITPAPAAPKGGYGAHIWLNRGTPKNPEDRPQAGLPADLYHLSGHEGQNVVVVPSKGLIVVRMGLTESGPRVVWELVRGVVEAVELADPA